MAKFGISGLDDLSKDLEKLSKDAQSMSGERTVDWSELFTDEFVMENTDFSNADEFFDKLPISSNDELEAVDDQVMDAFSSEHSDYDSFQDLLDEAAEEYYQRQLFDGIG